MKQKKFQRGGCGGGGRGEGERGVEGRGCGEARGKGGGGVREGVVRGFATTLYSHTTTTGR